MKLRNIEFKMLPFGRKVDFLLYKFLCKIGIHKYEKQLLMSKNKIAQLEKCYYCNSEKIPTGWNGCW